MKKYYLYLMFAYTFMAFGMENKRNILPISPSTHTAEPHNLISKAINNQNVSQFKKFFAQHYDLTEDSSIFEFEKELSENNIIQQELFRQLQSQGINDWILLNNKITDQDLKKYRSLVKEKLNQIPVNDHECAKDCCKICGAWSLMIATDSFIDSRKSYFYSFDENPYRESLTWQALCFFLGGITCFGLGSIDTTPQEVKNLKSIYRLLKNVENNKELVDEALKKYE